MHLGMSVAYHFHVSLKLTLTPELVSRIILSTISAILYEVGITVLVLRCILRWWSVAYHSGVIVPFNLVKINFQEYGHVESSCINK